MTEVNLEVSLVTISDIEFDDRQEFCLNTQALLEVRV